MSYQKRFFCFTMLLFSICILLYGLNVKLTALAYPPEFVEKSSINPFEFLEEYDYKVKEVNGLWAKELTKIPKENNYDSYEIDSYKDISTNELDIDCMEAIDMRNLLKGDSAICIDYKGKYSGVELKESSMEKVLDKFIKIGVISFHSVNKDPYFRLSNYEASIGIGTKNFIIPSVAYELTPLEISDFNVYSYISHVNNNYIEGAIIIKRQKLSDSLLDEISLKELNLSDRQISSINGVNPGYSTLEIVKNYVFTIPLNIIMKENEFIFEHRDDGYDTLIEVELPLRFQARVLHK